MYNSSILTEKWRERQTWTFPLTSIQFTTFSIWTSWVFILLHSQNGWSLSNCKIPKRLSKPPKEKENRRPYKRRTLARVKHNWALFKVAYYRNRCTISKLVTTASSNKVKKPSKTIKFQMGKNKKKKNKTRKGKYNHGQE